MGEQIFLLHFNNKKTTEQIEYICEYLKPYISKIRVVLCENNGIGKPMCDNIRLKFDKDFNKHFIEEFYTNNETKTRVINQLQVAFEQRKIQLLDIEQQTAELSMYEAKINPKTGNVCYNAPIGGNDDLVIALLLAYEAKMMKSKKGNYCLSFI